jgi:hypothetical protein
MGSVDSYRFEIVAKSVLVLVFILYCVAQLVFGNDKTSPKTSNPYRGGVYIDVAISGGSNALYGVSAREMEDDLGAVVNLAMPYEGVGRINYVDWLAQAGIKTRLVVDSPIAFWSNNNLRRQERKDTSVFNLLPHQSLQSFLLTLLAPHAVSDTDVFERDARGDLIRHVCNDMFFPFSVTIATLRRTGASYEYFAERLETIREATRAKRIAFRVPPIWVTESTKRHIEPMLRHVIAEFRAHGIPVVEQQAMLITDKTFFCEVAHHPNSTGRAYFSADLVQALRPMN